MRIALTSLGQSWAIIPELTGFLYPRGYDFFKNHPDAGKINSSREFLGAGKLDELWVLATEERNSLKAVDKIRMWSELVYLDIPIRVWITSGLSDLFSPEDCAHMRDAVLRLCMLCRKLVGRNTEIIFSLAGGRKTMSADIQYSASFFGPGVLIHVADRNIPPYFKDPDPSLLLIPPGRELASSFMPLIIGKYPENSLSAQIDSKDFTLPEYTPHKRQYRIPLDKNLAQKVDGILNSASNFLFYQIFDKTYAQKESSNYSRLFVLPPARIKDLRNIRLGIEPERTKEELVLVKKLPKADLHCHLGGVLTVEEIVEIARIHENEVGCWERKHEGFHRKREEWMQIASKGDPTAVSEKIGGERIRELRVMFKEIPQPFTVCGFLLCFIENPHLLEQALYGRWMNESDFTGIGMNEYERLGDLQGSALLQTEPVIRAVVRKTVEKCIEDNVTYLELRCSPQNYTRGGLKIEKVFGIIDDELKKASHRIENGIILITSRHRKMDEIFSTIELIDHLVEENRAGRILGVDLAGDETSLAPANLREHFLRFMDRCMHITIHAGENQVAGNIWEAVYHLSAERIGHGLTLSYKPELMKKFLDRGIGIEMCPSSNRQIVGYTDFCQEKVDKAISSGIKAEAQSSSISEKRIPHTYPLKEFLDYGLKVSVNTDNMGISRTSLSKELLQAARLTPRGLSVMEILQLIKNAYSSAFTDHDTRKKLILDSERRIIELFQSEEVLPGG
ncbi:MAG: hypothetical protein DRP87_00485 [Spirochaetes bacterium]|nr:MAG: hypothetical protein DRP87_00485 [Spirochaetota bacterium]